jgi:hypothetical protein
MAFSIGHKSEDKKKILHLVIPTTVTLGVQLWEVELFHKLYQPLLLASYQPHSPCYVIGDLSLFGLRVDGLKATLRYHHGETQL